MKRKYTNEHASCTVHVNQELPKEMQKRVREVRSVTTTKEYRRQGYATELMKAVCEDADLENMVLILQPRSFDSTAGVGNAKLIEWYKRFGFVLTQKQPALMARAPTFKARQTMVNAAAEKVTRGN